ncbi:MAG: hypothetical protein IJG59_10140 [Erysipelotrichaceae bacterium]|nr:hypothetical protein [Erysipelotrichaceae bacterium]
MAKKGQRFNKYPKEMIEALKEAYKNGNVTKNSIARDYNVPFNTVGTWIYKWNNPEKYPRQGEMRGRPKGLEIDWKERYEILKKYQAFLKAQRERK